MQTNLKKLLTIALAAAALTTASLGATGEAFAKGGKGGGGHHHSFFRSGIYFSSPVVSSCWRWFGGKRIWVCY